MFRLLGYRPGEVEPSIEALHARVHPDDLPRVVAARGQAQTDERIADLVYRIVHSGGEIRWVRGAGDVVSLDGGPPMLVGTLVDITESQRALGALQQAEALIEAMQVHTGVGHFVFDPVNNKLHRSQGLQTIIGRGPDDEATVGLQHLHPADSLRQQEWARRALRGEPIEPLGVRIVRSDGAVRSIETRGRLVQIEGAARLVGTVTDVTDRVLVEERLRHLSKLEAVGTLAAGVSHDFNNYLTIIAGQLAVARESAAAAAPALEAASLAVQQCMHLTRQLLAFGMQQAVDARPLELSKMLMEMRPLLERLVGPTVSVTVRAAERSFFVRADAGQLESAVVNLSINARDAQPNGGSLEIDVDTIDLDADRGSEGLLPGPYVRVRVSDAGTGIAPELLPRVFEPYFTTKPLGEGSGLGLASVYGTVRQHRGHIDVESGRQGTVFTILLPAAEPAITEAPCVEVDALARDIRVLVVDDVASVRELAAWYLRAEGLRPAVAADGEAALAHLTRERVDVVITDVLMPGMTGSELARRLDALSPPPAIVFMTGYADPRDLEKLRGVVVSKPFDARSLRRAIAEALRSTPGPCR